MNKFIDETVFNCMNETALTGDHEGLERWLKECNEEINRRESQKESIFPLEYEKKYLEYLLQEIKPITYYKKVI